MHQGHDKITDIYSCDAGLYYRMLATYNNVVGATKGRKGAKKPKDRLTVGLFWNIDGTDFWEPV